MSELQAKSAWVPGCWRHLFSAADLERFDRDKARRARRPAVTLDTFLLPGLRPPPAEPFAEPSPDPLVDVVAGIVERLLPALVPRLVELLVPVLEQRLAAKAAKLVVLSLKANQ